MRRRGLVIVFILCSVLLLASCKADSYTTVKSYGNHTATAWDMTYEKFNGHKSQTITVKEGMKCEIEVAIESESGELDLSIVNTDGKSYYNGTNIPTSQFTVTLDESGKYEIEFNAKKHKGSFDVTWKMVE